jgi:hypothetical protein
MLYFSLKGVRDIQINKLSSVLSMSSYSSEEEKEKTRDFQRSVSALPEFRGPSKQ